MGNRTVDLRAIFSDLATCIGFYTRIPVPACGRSAGGFAAAQWAAPVAGIAIGLAGGLILWAALRSGLPASAAAAIALGATVAATGALHEDGLADVADGFGGGAKRERKLEIMKDSRIGTYGVCALALSILARWSALAALASAGGGAVTLALVAAHSASRALLPGFMMLVRPARETGLSAGVGAIDGRTAGAALAIGCGVLLAAGIGFALTVGLLLALWFLALKRLCERQIGGQTGDVLGALQQGGEIIALFAACAFLL